MTESHDMVVKSLERERQEKSKLQGKVKELQGQYSNLHAEMRVQAEKDAKTMKELQDQHAHLYGKYRQLRTEKLEVHSPTFDAP